MKGRTQGRTQTFDCAQGERGSALQVILAVLGGLLVLVVIVVLVVVWAVRHYVQVEVQRSGDVERVHIRTPVGDLDVVKATDVARRLRLPIYPGAEPEDESGSVRLRGRLWDEEGGLDITAATFRTTDSLTKVDAWYRERLGPDFERRKGKISGGDRDWKIRVEPGGDDILYSREREGHVRCVALKREDGDVKITLCEIAEARHL